MSGWQSDVARSIRIDKLRQHLNTEHNTTNDTIDAIIRDAGFFRGERSLMDYHDDLHLPVNVERDEYGDVICEWEDTPMKKRLTKQQAGRRRRLITLALTCSLVVAWAYEVDHRWDGDERPSVEATR